MPNWLVPRTPVVEEDMAVTVLEPEVKVVPFTVIVYPEPAFVEAASCDEAVAVEAGENNWLKLMAPLDAVEQSGTPPVLVIVPPEQKISDSGIVPVRIIWVAVDAPTVPLSVDPVVTLVLV